MQSSKTFVCIASGPSLNAHDCELVRLSGLTTIAVNNSWQLAPWCDHLYAGDLAWWDAHVQEVPSGPKRWSCTRQAVPSGPKRWSCTRQAVAKHGLNWHEAYGSYNSGLRAIELAFKLGADKVLLLGFDCTIENGTHWHGDHKGTKNPDEIRCREWAKQHARLARKSDVINCSRSTSLECYKLGYLEAELTAAGAIDRI